MAVSGSTALNATRDTLRIAHHDERALGGIIEDLIDTVAWTKLAVTVPSESGNAFAITVQLDEADGTNIATGGTGYTYRAKLYSAAMVELATAAYTITVTGGSAVTTDAQADVIFTLAAAGTATLTVADVSTSSTATIYLVLEPIGHMGVKQYASMTFA